MSLFWRGTKTTLAVVGIILAYAVADRTSGNLSGMSVLAFFAFLFALILGGIQLLCDKAEHEYLRGWIAGLKTATFFVGTVLVISVCASSTGDVSSMALWASAAIVVAAFITLVQWYRDL